MVVKGVRSAINARGNPGVVIVVAGSMSGVTIKNLDIRMSGLVTNVGLQFSQSGLATVNGVRLLGPAGGQGIGIDSLPGTGHVRVFGNTGPSEISGLGIGMRAIRPASGLEINKVTVRDVTIGMESDSARISQWFNSTISCQRANSIGFRQIAVDGEDHHLVIERCTVAVQLECDPAENCGMVSEWAITKITTNCVEAPNCVSVRAITPSGLFDGDQAYLHDPACNASWNQSVVINGVPIQAASVGICP